MKRMEICIYIMQFRVLLGKLLTSKATKFLSNMFPNMKQDEVELLARISTKKELREYAEAHGTDKKDVNL